MKKYLPAFLLVGALQAAAQTNVFPTSGNVGIGTTTPQDKLHVAGAIRSDGPEVPGFYAFNGATPLAAMQVNVGNSIVNIGDFYSSAPSFALGFYTADVERLRISTSGNVGIGTTAPAARLHTHGASDGSNFYFTTTGAAVGWNGGAYSDNSFRINHAGVASRFMIDGSGNVGIGTTSPTHKLTVNGTIRAKEVIVETGWADHVFAADYRLAPLSEVEQHIQQNGHLPDVPSAAAVAQRGVSVGEMQKILLQKIEELTLHVIRQEKQLQVQQAEIVRMRSQDQPLVSH